MLRNPNVLGALLAMAASAILSFIDNFVEPVSQEAGLWQFQVFRTLMAVPILLIAARALGQSVWPKNISRLLGRSLGVSIGLLIYFASLGTLPVAQAGAGLFSAPIWVVILSALLFGSRIRPIQIIPLVAGFAGALLLLQPNLTNLTTLSLLPLAAGLFYGLGMLLTRFWCREEAAITLAVGIFLTMGVLSLFLLAKFTLWPSDPTSDEFLTRPWATPTLRFLYLTAFQGVGAVVAVSLIAQAYRTGAPPVVAVFEYSFLIFASLWAFLLWGSTNNLLAWVGIFVIVAAGIIMAMLQRDDA
ncbi:MAG: DMT family transporter [Pikeienuella sp.]